MVEHRCTQFTPETFASCDNILCMDQYNYEELEYFSKNTGNIKKVQYLRNFDPSSFSNEIDDPICAQLAVYENTYQQCLTSITNYIQKYKSVSGSIDTSALSGESFSNDKNNVIFICPDNLRISPLCEAIFNQTLKTSQSASKFSIFLQGKLYSGNWEEHKCSQVMIDYGKSKGLDFSTHQCNNVFEDILQENDFIIVPTKDLKRKVKAMDRSRSNSKSYKIITLNELTGNKTFSNLAVINSHYTSLDTLFKVCKMAIDEFFTKF